MAATSRGMNSPVFWNQNQIGFSSCRSQPNSQAKKLRALTAEWDVDHHNCGKAISDAVKKNVNHSRQRLSNKARHPPIAMTTTKLCACSSGKTPAAIPAAIMRRTDNGIPVAATLSGSLSFLLGLFA